MLGRHAAGEPGLPSMTRHTPPGGTGIVNDLVGKALNEMVPGGVRPGELRRETRTLRWVETGTGSPVVVLDAALGEPGSLAWAGVMPAVAARTRVVAYYRACIGASDPVSPLTLDSQVGDLTALVSEVGNGPCILAGHSWGGLLAQLVALRNPELIAGLVLIDPADESYWAALPPEVHRHNADTGAMILRQHASGELAGIIRDTFRPFAERLTGNPGLQDLILNAYVSCYARQSQAQMIQDENQLFTESVPLIQRIRESGTLPDVPIVVFSATTGTPAHQREKWTSIHADLVTTVPRGRHIVLAETDHAINQERPDEISRAINQLVSIG